MISKVLAGALGVVVVISMFLGWRLLAAHERIGEFEFAVEQATLTNKDNQIVITNISGKLDTCVADRAVDEQQNEITVANLRALTAKLETDAARVKADRKEIFRDPTCEELGNLDIGALCPAWAVSLRERATTISQN